MGPEGVLLEHHPNASLVSRDLGDALPVGKNSSGILALETGDDTKKGGLATARGPEDEEEITGLDRKGYVPKNLSATKALGDRGKLEGGHRTGISPEWGVNKPLKWERFHGPVCADRGVSDSSPTRPREAPVVSTGLLRAAFILCVVSHRRRPTRQVFP